MGVGVDEAGHDHGLREVAAAPDLSARAHPCNAAVLEHYRATLDRLPFDRKQPIGGEDRLHGEGDASRARLDCVPSFPQTNGGGAVSYTHLRAHETRHDLVCRLLLEKKKKTRER